MTYEPLASAISLAGGVHIRQDDRAAFTIFRLSQINYRCNELDKIQNYNSVLCQQPSSLKNSVLLKSEKNSRKVFLQAPRQTKLSSHYIVHKERQILLETNGFKFQQMVLETNG